MVHQFLKNFFFFFFGLLTITFMSPWCVFNVVMVFFNFYENFSKSKFWPTCTLMHRWCCRWCRFCYGMLCAWYICDVLTLWMCFLSTLWFTFMLLCALCFLLICMEVHFFTYIAIFTIIWLHSVNLLLFLFSFWLD